MAPPGAGAPGGGAPPAAGGGAQVNPMAMMALANALGRHKKKGGKKGKRKGGKSKAKRK